MKKVIVTFSVSLLLLLFNSNSAQAQFVVRVRPIAPVEVARPCPGPHFVWIGGHWHWNARYGRYVWRQGNWMRERVGYAWVPGFWINHPRGSEWAPGHWRRA